MMTEYMMDHDESLYWIAVQTARVIHGEGMTVLQGMDHIIEIATGIGTEIDELYMMVDKVWEEYYL